jgi:pimeloyl-ACP methyl ester carboxylesterase
VPAAVRPGPRAADRTLLVGGSPVRVHVLGSGPAVLVLHGSGPGTTAWGAWRATAEALAARLQVVAPDQAGFGATPAPTGARPGRALWTAQATGVMDALGIERYAVAGHSMGGAVALSAAAARPEAVRAVAAIATLGAPMSLPPALDRLWAAQPTPEDAAVVQRLIAPAGDNSTASGAAATGDRAAVDPPAVDPAAVEARLEAMRAQGGAAYAALFPPPRERWIRDLALSPEELGAVRAPALLVHGARDRLVPLRDALPLIDRLPNAQLYVLGRGGHAPHAEQPEIVLPLLADFLETDA